jgi:hypothetical protein
VDVQALNDFGSLRAACSAATRGEVVIVQPDEDAARAIPGWPDKLTAKAPTATGNGKVSNKPDGTAVGMSAPMNDIDLATHRALAALRAKKEALERTVGTAGVSAAISSEAFRQAAEEAVWQLAKERSPGAHVDRARAMIDAGRRRAAMEATALGREVLARERAEDAGRR